MSAAYYAAVPETGGCSGFEELSLLPLRAEGKTFKYPARLAYGVYYWLVEATLNLYTRLLRECKLPVGAGILGVLIIFKRIHEN